MHLGLDLLFMLPRETGGRETYARELIGSILEQEPQLRITAFTNRESAPAISSDMGAGMRVIGLPMSPRQAGQWAAGELLLLPAAARRHGIDVLHSLANFAPISGPFRRVITIHDLQYRALPQMLSWSMRSGTRILLEAGARRADRVVAVSKAGADELVSLGIERTRIDVIPNGVRRPGRVSPFEQEKLRERLNLGDRRLVLTVSTNLPHKNLPLLLEAFALIDTARRPMLALVGHGTDAPQLAERARALGIEDDLRVLGYLRPAALEALYGLADCVVIPSLYEGFGLPAVEAMARSVPVICSDIAALREVTGGAALYFDPSRARAASEGIIRLLGDGALQARLAAAGAQRATQFSWSAAASATLACYDRALAA